MLVLLLLLLASGWNMLRGEERGTGSGDGWSDPMGSHTGVSVMRLGGPSHHAGSGSMVGDGGPRTPNQRGPSRRRGRTRASLHINGFLALAPPPGLQRSGEKKVKNKGGMTPRSVWARREKAPMPQSEPNRNAKDQTPPQIPPARAAVGRRTGRSGVTRASTGGRGTRRQGWRGQGRGPTRGG